MPGLKIAKKQVHCWLCLITLSDSGNTTNLGYQIRKHHSEHLKDIEELGTKEKEGLSATLIGCRP